MKIFDKLVNEALNNKPELNSSRLAVEKEILHHDILKILNENGFLTKLTFIGGTALRCCYNGQRLSEDLDFTGGKDFTESQLTEMGKLLQNSLSAKYGLPINVREPRKDEGLVSTWKIVIETKPENKSSPAQHINIDICALSSYDKKLKMLQNHYGINLGTSGLILQVQSAEEIFADKLIAFALRSNRPKYRDLWDIYWLHQQGYKPNLMLVPKKLNERNVFWTHFIHMFKDRLNFVSTTETCRKEFYDEMKRFIQIKTDNMLWPYLIELIRTLNHTLTDLLNGFIGVFPTLNENEKTTLQLDDWRLELEDISIDTEKKTVILRFKNEKDEFIRVPFSFEVFYLLQSGQCPENIEKYIFSCLQVDKDLKQPLNVFINTIYADNLLNWYSMLDKESPNIILDRFKLLMLRSSADKLCKAICIMDRGESISLCSTGDPQYPYKLAIMYL
ncbi:MAG: nucleotidyl transferase AbiEii/AbiGii toxin family protein [Alphaproteobacteria bacterium]|nr:nucleotidyl transferase AbiEii/AbiGii toxin family protein [Alphaproteobacteria bacterium]